jgi:hypothetical protein
MRLSRNIAPQYAVKLTTLYKIVCNLSLFLCYYCERENLGGRGDIPCYLGFGVIRAVWVFGL